jgi:hypothetical protein
MVAGWGLAGNGQNKVSDSGGCGNSWCPGVGIGHARVVDVGYVGGGIEAALVNPSTLIPEPWQASSEGLTQVGVDAMAVDLH